MSMPKDPQARRLSVRLKELGETFGDPALTAGDYALLSFAGGYLLGLASRVEDVERELEEAQRSFAERDIPPHCETCDCTPEDGA